MRWGQRKMAALRTIVGFWLVLSALAAPALAAAPPSAPIVDDAVILLDVTGSMRGEGPDSRASDIWDKTVNAVLDIVDRLAPQTNLALVPFSNGPEWSNVFPGPIASGDRLIPRQLASEADREAFRVELRKLVANGEATWLYESLEYSLTQLRQWREADPGNTHRQALFLYTDGIDNGPHAKDGIHGTVQLLRDQRGDFRGLYFVYNDLGSQLSPEQRALLAENGVTVTVGPPTSNVELVSEKLDFGNLAASGSSQAISFRSGFADVWGRLVRLRIETAGSTLPVAVAAETVKLSEQITVVLTSTGSLPAGQHQARLIIEPVDGAFNLIPRNSLDLTFSAVAPPTPTAVPELVASPVPTPVPAPPRLSIVGGVPDPLLFLGIFALLVGGTVSSLWQLELWLFKRPVPTAQLIWKLGEEPTMSHEEGLRVRTIKPRRSRPVEEWIIGVEGYVTLLEGGEEIRPNHAKIAYGGKKRRDLRLFPIEGEVRVDDKAIAADGLALVDGSTFVVGPYHFRFELLDETR